MNKRGATAAITALVMVALVGCAGLAVDTARAWLVEDRLKTAIDAASLVAARQISDPNRDAQATKVFWAQFSQGGGSHNYLGATVSGLLITPDANDSSKIKISATATVPTTLFGVISKQTVSSSDYAVAQRAGSGLEIALVLDQTSSMNTVSGGQTKLAAAKAAVQTLLGILYGNKDTQLNLWVSVVPFARTINVGTANSGFLDTTNMPPGWDVTKWSGCIEALRSGSDLSEAAPTGGSKFRPYFWPSTYKLVGTATGRCTTGNAYPKIGGTSYCHGDDDWDAGSGAPSQTDLNNNVHVQHPARRGHEPEPVGGSEHPVRAHSDPTAYCKPDHRAERGECHPGTSKERWHHHGHRTSGCLVYASPSWQGVWQNPNAGIPNTPALPLPYNTPHMKKVVVMLTDGDDNWQPAYGSTCGSSSDSVCSSASGSESLYDAYGRVTNKYNAYSSTYNAAFSSAKISPFDQTHADPALNTRFTAVCNAMKQAGVVVYIIGFEVASADLSRLQTCASSTADYIASPTAANLQTAFTQVANQLASLRLAE